MSAIYADLKAFVAIRMENRQHKEDGIGGGNVAMSLVLFAAIGFLAKVQYFVDVKGKVTLKDGVPFIVEEEAFVHLVRALSVANIDLGLSGLKGPELTLIWKNFRNKLVHVTTVERGHQMANFVMQPTSGISVDKMIRLFKASSSPAFQKEEFWRVNPDVVLSFLLDITNTVNKNLGKLKLDENGLERLDKIVG